MQKGTNFILNKNRFRCDQCVLKHSKCDKLLPSCTTCKERNTYCTYQMRRDTKGNSIFIINESKQSMKGKRRQHDESKSKMEIQNQFKIKKLPKDYDMPYKPLGIFHRFPRKDLLINIMTLLQFPSPFKSNLGLTLFVGLVDELGLMVVRANVKKPLLGIQKPNFPNMKLILDKAIDNYFSYGNSLFPIFIKQQFKFHSKSETLKKAIILCGMHYMESTKANKSIIDYLVFKLEKLLAVTPRIKPSLQNIQALIILIGSINYIPFLAKNLENYFFFCQKASDLIGLHLTNNKLSKVERIERDMTYYSMKLLYHFWRLNVGIIIGQPYKPYTLNNEFKLMVNKVINGNQNENKVPNSKVEYYFRLTISIFNIELSSILYSVYLLKEKHISVDSTHVDLRNQAANLIERVQRLKQFYLRVFSHITKEVAEDKFISLTNYTIYIISNYYYLRFYIYSLKFYSLNQGQYHANVIEYLNDEYIAKTIKECQLAVEYLIKIPYQWVNRFTIAFLVQCLTFLLRYKNQNDNNNNIFRKGLQHLNQMAKMERINSLIIHNLKLIEIIDKKLMYKKTD